MAEKYNASNIAVEQILNFIPDSAVEKKFLFLGYKSNCVAVEKNLV